MDEMLAKLTRELSVAQAANDAKLAEYARQGVNMDPTLMLSTRLGVLIDTLIGEDGTLARTQYEIAVQHAGRKLLDHIGSQIARAKLLHNVNGASVPKLN